MAFYVGRYESRIEKSYKIEVVTPMFLGGAESGTAELRVQSIKGLLRFWWRALHPGLSVNELFDKEGEIFGSTEGDKPQKSGFSFYIDESDIKTARKVDAGRTFNVEHKKLTANIFHYLSVGLFNMKEKTYIRDHITPGSIFILHFIYKDENVKNEVEDALKALIHFGSIGAKSRNGFGSLHSDDIPIIKIGERKENPLSDYSAFSEKSSLYKFKEHQTWNDALSEIGLNYRNMRLSKNIGVEKHNTSLRRLLALPIVTDKSLPNKRHAKPCFLKVAKTPEGKYQGQILVMPYAYSGPIADKNNQYNIMIDEMSNVLQTIKNNQKVDTIY